MRREPVMDPYTAWANKAVQQTHRNARACSDAGGAIAANRAQVVFSGVSLIEWGETVDVGALTVRQYELVFAGSNVTRRVPFSTIVLIDTPPVLGAPGRVACSVNSYDYPNALVFLGEQPVEYHVAAWYSRWLRKWGCTDAVSSATVPAITPT
jgi:hypothetical protein